MANRYWVGGSGSWTATATTNWSATSGGSAGASAPTSTDNVFFDQAGAYTVAMSGALAFNNITVSAGTVTFTETTGSLNIYGNMSFISGTVWSGTLLMTLGGSGVTQTVRTNGTVFNCPITFNPGATGAIQLLDNFNTATSILVTLSSGVLDLNNNTLSCGRFAINAYTGIIRNIYFGSSGAITVSPSAGGTAFTLNSSSTGITITGTPTINVISTQATITTVNAVGGSPALFNFNISSTGNYQVNISSGSSVNNLNFTGFTALLGATGISIYGNLTLVAGATFTSTSLVWAFIGNTTQTITSNGAAFPAAMTIGNASGNSTTLVLNDAFTMSSGRTCQLQNGTLNLNGKTFTCLYQFIVYAGGGGTAVPVNITFNGGTLALLYSNSTLGSFDALTYVTQNTGKFTTTAGTGTGTISLTPATGKVFWGGGFVYNCTLNQGGVGNLTITGNNTFNDMTCTATSIGATNILFAAGSTQTVNNFSISGSYNFVYLKSNSAGTAWYLYKPYGIVSGVNSLIITDGYVGNAVPGYTNNTTSFWYGGLSSTWGGLSGGDHGGWRLSPGFIGYVNIGNESSSFFF